MTQERINHKHEEASQLGFDHLLSAAEIAGLDNKRFDQYSEWLGNRSASQADSLRSDFDHLLSPTEIAAMDDETLTKYSTWLKSQRQTQAEQAPQPEPRNTLRHQRRTLSKGRALIAAALITTVASVGIGYETGFKPPLPQFGAAPSETQPEATPTPSTAGASEIPGFAYDNPYHIGEGQPQNGTLTLNTGQEVIASLLKKDGLGWMPDGRSPYVTVLDNGKPVRRYFFSGGPDNATYMVQTDGTEPLEQMLINKQLPTSSFVEVFGPDSNTDYRKYYAGITSILQFDKSNPNHLLATYHGENRPSRDASNAFVATIGLAESTDGGQTWVDKGPLIQGTDVAYPGYKDSKGQYRVSGAGQPAAFYNPEDGYVHFAWVDWRADESKPDQIYGARAKANDNGTLGPMEYWTNNGYSTDFNGNKNNLKPIVPVPQDQPAMNYVALPSMTWSTSLNEVIMTDETDIGFAYETSTDFVNWTEPKIMYSFSQQVSITDQDGVLEPFGNSNSGANTGPVQETLSGEPHSILQVGQLWESYPTLWDETKTSSDAVGANVVLLHSAGDNIVPHEPTFMNGTITIQH